MGRLKGYTHAPRPLGRRLFVACNGRQTMVIGQSKVELLRSPEENKLLSLGSKILLIFKNFALFGSRFINRQAPKTITQHEEVRAISFGLTVSVKKKRAGNGAMTM